MKESHNENLANYIGRESCATYCEVYSEALTAVHTGWVLSLENRWSRMQTQLCYVECNRTNIIKARCLFILRGRRPHARVETYCRESGGPVYDQAGVTGMVVTEKRKK